MATDPTPGPLRGRLRAELRVAMKARDTAAVAALRSTLGAIDNAEAVAPAAGPAPDESPIAGASVGVGSSEVARRELSEADVTAIVADEVRGLRAAAAEYTAAGRPEHAADVAHQATLLERFVD